MQRRLRSPLVAPALDGLCLAVFVLAGRQSHGIDDGAGWYVTVLWPVAAGWFAAALAVGLYTRASRPWLRLAATVLAGVGIGLVVRIAVTHRDTPPAFVLVSYAFLILTTAGWRLISAAWPRVIARRRG